MTPGETEAQGGDATYSLGPYRQIPCDQPTASLFDLKHHIRSLVTLTSLQVP